MRSTGYREVTASVSRRSFVRQVSLLTSSALFLPELLAQKQENATPLFYPLHAIHAGLEGTAKVYVEVSDDGYAMTSRIETSSGHLILDQAAEGAIHTWVFKENLPEAKRRVIFPIEFKVTEKARKDLPKKDKSGNYIRRSPKTFFPYRALERNLEGKVELLAKISPEGLATEVSVLSASKHEPLNKCAAAFVLIRAFGSSSLSNSDDKTWEAIVPYEFKIR